MRTLCLLECSFLWQGSTLGPSGSTLAVRSCSFWLGTLACFGLSKQFSPVAWSGVHVGLLCVTSAGMSQWPGWSGCGFLWVAQSEHSCGTVWGFAVLLQVALAVSPWAWGGAGPACSGSNSPCLPVAWCEACAELLQFTPTWCGAGVDCSGLLSLQSPVAGSEIHAGLLWVTPSRTLGEAGTGFSVSDSPCSPGAQSGPQAGLFQFTPARLSWMPGWSGCRLLCITQSLLSFGLEFSAHWVALGCPESRSQGSGWSVHQVALDQICSVVLGPGAGKGHSDRPGLQSLRCPGAGSWDSGSPWAG